MKRLIVRTQVLAADIETKRLAEIAASDSWFKNLSKKEQDAYIKQHPTSKYAKQAAKKVAPAVPAKKAKPAAIIPPKKSAKVEKLVQGTKPVNGSKNQAVKDEKSKIAKKSKTAEVVKTQEKKKAPAVKDAAKQKVEKTMTDKLAKYRAKHGKGPAVETPKAKVPVTKDKKKDVIKPAGANATKKPKVIKVSAPAVKKATLPVGSTQKKVAPAVPAKKAKK